MAGGVEVSERCQMCLALTTGDQRDEGLIQRGQSWKIEDASMAEENLSEFCGQFCQLLVTASNFLFQPLGSLPAEGPGSEGVRVAPPYRGRSLGTGEKTQLHKGYERVGRDGQRR
jgi:hypothetical protein